MRLMLFVSKNTVSSVFFLVGVFFFPLEVRVSMYGSVVFGCFPL